MGWGMRLWPNTAALTVSILMLALRIPAACAQSQLDEEGWASFSLVNGHIHLPITLNQVEGEAIVDTGSEINGIDDNFVAAHRSELHFGKYVTVNGVFTEAGAQIVNGASVGLFGTTTTVSGLMTVHINPALLLLGESFLRNFIVQIDYPNHRLRLLDRKVVNLDKVANVDLRTQKGTMLPMVNVFLSPNDKLWLTLDTGYTGGVFLPRSALAEYEWLVQSERASAQLADVHGVGTVEQLRIPYLKFGPFRMENVLLTMPARGQETEIGRRAEYGSMRWTAGKESKGLLGYDVLQHFVLTIDLAHRLMHVGVPAPRKATD